MILAPTSGSCHRLKCVNDTWEVLKTVTGTAVTPLPHCLEPSELSFNANPPGSPLILGPYPLDELAEREIDQAMLQEGSSPTQIVGAVARHVRQAPGRQVGRQAGLVDQGLEAGRVGGGGETEYPGAEAQMPNGEPGIKHS